MKKDQIGNINGKKCELIYKQAERTKFIIFSFSSFGNSIDFGGECFISILLTIVNSFKLPLRRKSLSKY
jgi:hypothetical protein